MSKQTKWTPGPWAWSDSGGIGSNNDLFGLGGKQVIAHAAYENMWFAAYDRDTDTANAHLIAAAPDLYDALERVVAAMRRYEMDVDAAAPAIHVAMMRDADAALTKARGETQGER